MIESTVCSISNDLVVVFCNNGSVCKVMSVVWPKVE